MHSIQFRRTRDAYLADVIVATNRLVIRLEKVGVALSYATGSYIGGPVACDHCSFSEC